MSKKSVIIIMAIACVACSTISFFIGFSLPHDSGDKTAQTTERQEENSDSKYEGLYIAEYYKNGGQITKKIYLNPNHDCKSPDILGQNYTCEWSIQDGRLIITSITGSGGVYKSTEDCQKAIDDHNNDDIRYYDIAGYKILEADEWNKAKGYACVVSPIIEERFDILNDGSLSGKEAHYYKR